MRLPTPLALLAVLIAAGCGGGDDDGSSDAGNAPRIEDPGPVHVHGLGINPKDGALFIATHTGLFRAAQSERTATRVGDRHHDLMGFTVAGPDRFLGSGHPDGRETLPPFLGLMRSRDAGESWEEVSLMGENDFHVLEVAGERLYGFGSNYETKAAEFLVSDDAGRTWEERSPPGGLVSLAISPDDPDHLVAAVAGGPAADGLHASQDAGRSWQPLADEVGLLAWARPDALYLIEADGAASASGDGGESWEAAGEIGGQPAAFEAAGDELYAALHDGTIRQSRDGGRTWTVRSRPQATVTE